MNQESDSPETGSKSTCDPSKDDMRFGCGLMAGVVLCVGGSILCLVEMYVYDLLDFNRLLPLMGILTIVFLVPWIKIIYLAPASTKLGRRGFKVLGSSVAAAFGSMITCIAVVLLVNGCGDKSVLTREVLCEDKGHSKGNKISYYARIRVPDNTNRIIDLSLTKEEYDALVPGKSVLSLATGRGNLRMEWIRKKEVVRNP